MFKDFIKYHNVKENFEDFAKKYADKRILLYGTGIFFSELRKICDFNKLNIVGVCDLKYEDTPQLKEDFGYPVFIPKNMFESDPEIILCTVQYPKDLIDNIKNAAKFYRSRVKIMSPVHTTEFSLLKFFRSFYFRHFKNRNNHIYLVDDFGIKKEVKKIKGLEITFYGVNNTVYIHVDSKDKFKNSKAFFGSNCLLKFARTQGDVINTGFYLYARNSKAVFGKNFGMRSGDLYISFEPNLSITFGDNCMCSQDIYIRTDDGHTVYDKDTKEVLNRGKDIIIGNNVWLGKHSTVLKGAVIPDNTVVAAGAIVNKEFNEEHTVLAGVPAKIVKRNICWSRLSPNNFEKLSRES